MNGSTRPQSIWRATVKVSPIQRVGSYDDCSSWCSAMLGKEVWIISEDGTRHAVGIITDTRWENLSGD